YQFSSWLTSYESIFSSSQPDMPLRMIANNHTHVRMAFSTPLLSKMKAARNPFRLSESNKKGSPLPYLLEIRTAQTVGFKQFSLLTSGLLLPCGKPLIPSVTKNRINLHSQSTIMVLSCQ
ncbi:MAG: hypothetical protein IKU21_02950, partial [Anaerotignum sp.]|nr:hypothetical protein [Anaerotignum sp.]